MQQHHRLSAPKKTKVVLFREEKASYLENTAAGKPQGWTNHLSGLCQWEKHDFKLFKESHTHVLPDTLLEADTGYLGLTDLHSNSCLPQKRSKTRPLTKQDRRENREVSRQRIFVEHAIRFVKRFRILSERYRNRRNRFALRYYSTKFYKIQDLYLMGLGL